MNIPPWLWKPQIVVDLWITRNQGCFAFASSVLAGRIMALRQGHGSHGGVTCEAIMNQLLVADMNADLT